MLGFPLLYFPSFPLTVSVTSQGCLCTNQRNNLFLTVFLQNLAETQTLFGFLVWCVARKKQHLYSIKLKLFVSSFTVAPHETMLWKVSIARWSLILVGPSSLQVHFPFIFRESLEKHKKQGFCNMSYYDSNPKGVITRNKRGRRTEPLRPSSPFARCSSSKCHFSCTHLLTWHQ